MLLEEGHLEMATAETNRMSTDVRNTKRPTGISVSFLNSIILGFHSYSNYLKGDINKYFFFIQCPHMFFTDSVVFPPGHGRSVTDF